MEGPSATVTFSDGTKKTGRWTHDKYNYDLALIFVSHPSIKPLPISRTQPQIGETVDQMGWGGNTKANRHYLAQIVEYEKAYTITNGAITSGDSGGGVINSRGELVGVNSIGKNLITNINGWPVHKEAGYVPQPATLAFTQRINKLANRGQLRPSYPGWGWRGDNCQPGGSNPFQPPIDPNPQPTPQPTQPEAPQVTQKDLQQINDRLDKLTNLLSSPPRGPPGPPGEKGERGEKGLPGITPGEISILVGGIKKIEEKIEPLKTETEERINTLQNQLESQGDTLSIQLQQLASKLQSLEKKLAEPIKLKVIDAGGREVISQVQIGEKDKYLGFKQIEQSNKK